MTAFLRAIFLLCLFWVGPALADQTYNQPRWFDDRLDWCLTWSNNCGKPAADNFCMRRRFTAAAGFEAEPGVGKTRVSGTNQICNGANCTGFRFITCTGPISTDRTFTNPAWKGSRLDACKSFGKDCGKPAADAFCVSNGFQSSSHSVLDATPGRGTTRVISNDQICDQSFCVGFQMIVCQ
jgi:hypothetical protein